MVEKDVIIALDFASTNEVKEFLQPFKGEPLYVKVGMELYYQTGPALLEWLKQENYRIFLDLKLHDIPNTVKKAMQGLATLGVDMVNVHAAGGISMMHAAKEGLEIGASGSHRPLCIAVTQLTSTSKQVMNEEILLAGEVQEIVRAYATHAKQAGLDGVVSSALEVPTIKEACGQPFLTVTPGIRLLGDATQDQKRVVTPDKACQLGSDFIVVGRSITQAKDPLARYREVKQLWEDNNQ